MILSYTNRLCGTSELFSLWHYRVPKSWWVCLLRLFQHTSQLVLNSKQLGYAVDIQVPQLLLWSRFEPLEYVTEGPQGEVVRYPRYLQIYSHVRRYPFDCFVLLDYTPSVVPVEFEIQFLGVLDKIFFGFTSFILFSEIEASLLAARMCFVLCCRNVDVTITHGAP